MKRELFEAALAKIPAVVAQIANYNTGKEYWRLSVPMHDRWGFDSNWYTGTLDIDKLKSHLQRAKGYGYTISVHEDAQSITVKMELPDNEYITAVYTPLVLEDGTLVEE